MFTEQFVAAKQASRLLNGMTTAKKNVFLRTLAAKLEDAAEAIISANAEDIAALSREGMSDRLMLDATRITHMADEVRTVADLPDEVGRIIEEKRIPNGMKISRIRVPIGVVGMIYESRPNVTIDATALAIKSGNAIVLKGGKESLQTNRALVKIIHEALAAEGLSADSVQFLDTIEREAVSEMLAARGLIDVIIPRGGKGLIDFCVQNGSIPVIETGASVVHTYVDEVANLAKAVDIVANEKTRRVSVCNALDTVLVHHSVADIFVRDLAQMFFRLHQESGIPLVKIHADETVLATLADVSYEASEPLTDADLETEWLDYVLNIKTVRSFDQALEHIQAYSLGHSEAICSEDPRRVERFLQEVDAACVYANVSTAFSDGAQFGLGAEIGISTQKTHVRGPFALEGLTSFKWIVQGNGQIRL